MDENEIKPVDGMEADVAMEAPEAEEETETESEEAAPVAAPEEEEAA